MKLEDLQYSYPDDLVATEPQRPSRVLWSQNAELAELTVPELLSRISPGDMIVLNDTRVESRRVFGKTVSGGSIEILFVRQMDGENWEVLCPASRLGSDRRVILPGGITGQVVKGGRPQVLKLDQPLDSEYFRRYGEVPLPPYIQKARGDRHSQKADEAWYQTEWAKRVGSSAAPTASLHFTNSDWDRLRGRGVLVETLTLHVGLGTYLPVQVRDLWEHPMHEEWVEIPSRVISQAEEVRKNGRRIWALGTTVARALESWKAGLLAINSKEDFVGGTRLLILEPTQFQVVDRLMTNFHQPESTLLALVMAFAGRNQVIAAYQYAIENRFRLFSYGDLSVWVK